MSRLPSALASASPWQWVVVVPTPGGLAVLSRHRTYRAAEAARRRRDSAAARATYPSPRCRVVAPSVLRALGVLV